MAGKTEWEECEICGYCPAPPQAVAKLPHQEVFEPGQEPTCENFGWTGGSFCSVCGVEIVPQTILHKLDHITVEVPELKPTCKTAGHTSGARCGREGCGAILYGLETIPATGHTYDPNVSSCTEDQVCLVCGEVTPSLGGHVEKVLPARAADLYPGRLYRGARVRGLRGDHC